MAKQPRPERAELLARRKEVFPNGAILEYVVWRLPTAVPGSPHRYKYRLYYGRDGVRIVGYDNERGKGDHRHVGERELPYTFSTVQRLIADFRADVKIRRAR